MTFNHHGNLSMSSKILYYPKKRNTRTPNALKRVIRHQFLGEYCMGRSNGIIEHFIYSNQLIENSKNWRHKTVTNLTIIKKSEGQKKRT